MVNYICRGVKGYNFQIEIIFLSLKMDFVLANSADPDEILHLLGVTTLVYIGLIHKQLTLAIPSLLGVSFTTHQMWRVIAQKLIK